MISLAAALSCLAAFPMEFLSSFFASGQQKL
jgi:hypothetical protein